MKKTAIQTPKEAFIVDYPEAQEMADKQLSILWFSKELGVESDKNDILTKCTDGERHGITTVLKLFTEYELRLGGEEFWGGKIAKMFPRHEIVAMATTFAMIERQVHSYFYDLINKTLNLATEEFYLSYKQDPILMERIRFIESEANNKNPFLSTAAFAFMEGVVLFSNFSYLKSFNTRGWNMIPHITAGIDASAKDENFHSLASAWLFRTVVKEHVDAGYLKPEQVSTLYEDIKGLASLVYQHECRITDLIFEKGRIRTITKEEVLSFIRHRVDTVLGYLGITPLFDEKESVVAEWFYTTLSAFKYSDFFASTQVQYVRDWNRNKLVWGE